MKSIVVAMDLHPASDRAFERAVLLAREQGARLTLVHAIDEQLLAYGEEDGLWATFAAKAEEKLSRHWRALPEDVAARFRHRIVAGSPWRIVVDTARAESADLTVLGTHRPDALKDIFVGTTAERIVRHSDSPVLVVADKPAGPYRTVLAATDFSPSSSRALGAALALAPGARATLLHVFEVPFPSFIRPGRDELEAIRQERMELARGQIERDVADFARTAGGDAAARIDILCERGDVVGGIHAARVRLRAELLAMGMRSRSGVAGAMLGSKAVAFLADPPCDILVAQ